MAPCEIHTSQRGNITILTLKGEIEVQRPHPIQTWGEQVLGNNCKKLILDFAGVSRATSSALGALISLQQTCNSTDAKMVLVNLNDKLLEVITTMKMQNVFTIIEGDLDDAQKHFE